MAPDLFRFPIVGIGASAGGILAMEELFGGLPDDCGMAFVIVTHLSPERESLLHEVVGHYTQMPVQVAGDDMKVEAGHVYVMPQNAILTIEKGVLRMRRPDALHRERKPVDIFFSELAQDQGEYAVGIILSGGDSDGTLGVKAVKEHGGMTMAQSADGSGPRNPNMPQSAISSDLIDVAAPADRMGEKLVAFARSFSVLDGLTSDSGGQEESDLDHSRAEIYAILRKHSGHDFSGYKTKTFLRRVMRRMQLGQKQSSNEELEASKEEMQSLNEELNTINAELTGKIEELDRANSDLKNLFESTGIATVFLDRELVIRSFTPAASTFFSLRPSDIGRPLTDLASRLDYSELKEHIGSVFATGEPLDHHLTRDSQGKSYLLRLSPYRTDTRVQGVVVTLVDVTRLTEAEERQKDLIMELNHRVRNMLAVAISIANHTLKSSSSKEAFHKALIGRLHAMARAHDLLSREQWTQASIKEVIDPELEPFGADRFAICGPDVRLTPQAGLSLGMVVHELATNAVKYGALSTPNGKVEMQWAVADQRLNIDWRERDGPLVDEPESTGFGFSLLKGEIGYRLGGKIETSFDPQGLSVRMSFPLNRSASQDAAAGPDPA